MSTAAPPPSPPSSASATATAAASPAAPAPSTDHHHPVDDGVTLVHWPEEAERREALAAAGRSCLLLVEADVAPPRCRLTEDWVRAPADPAELAARRRTLAAREACTTRPALDDGLLLFRGSWVAVPPGQVAMVELLVACFGRTVRKEELAAAAVAAGASAHETAVKAAMGRLAKRLAPLGLELTSVRARGYLLQAHGECRLHAAGSAAAPGGEPGDGSAANT